MAIMKDSQMDSEKEIMMVILRVIWMVIYSDFC
jgi:hypothetical protein